jgi:hypothetical protein
MLEQLAVLAPCGRWGMCDGKSSSWREIMRRRTAMLTTVGKKSEKEFFIQKNGEL